MGTMFCTYLATNLTSGKRYVGKARDPHKRWADHRKAAWKSDPSGALHRAIRKYGWPAFLWEVLDWYEIEEEAFAAEREGILKYGTKAPLGYNLTDGGEGASGCNIPHPNMVGKRWQWSPEALFLRSYVVGACYQGPRSKKARQRRGVGWHGQCRAQPHRSCWTPRLSDAGRSALTQSNKRRAEPYITRDMAAVAAYRDGETRKAVAERFGIHPRHLSTLLHRYGAQSPT